MGIRNTVQSETNMIEQFPLNAPDWLIKMVRRVKMERRSSRGLETKDILLDQRLNTVCNSAQCPNRQECFSRGTATFMILGKICTRNCTFCAVAGGRPEVLDKSEPERISTSVSRMCLSHVVITSVTRDDLPDGGAKQFAEVIHSLRSLKPPVSVEVLLPDFQGSFPAMQIVLDSAPHIIAHNMETINRLYPVVRPVADYHRSLAVLSYAAKEAKKGTFVKSGFMVGLGEKDEEIFSLMKDLKHAGVTMLTIGQYLAPSLRHYPVQRFVSTDQFTYYENSAREMGFIHVAAGPLIRSSYRAGEIYREVA